MARPMTNSARYFPFDVDYFSDRRIRRVRRELSMQGILMHISLLCSIYSDRSGFFTELDENLIFDLAESFSISEKACREIVLSLVEIGLFDKKLFREHNVLTSVSVQSRFQEIIKGRGQKRKIGVCKRFWLLDEVETAAYIDFSENNESFSKKNSTKEKKGKKKENENKEKAKESQQNSHRQAAAALAQEYEKYIGRASPNVVDGINEYLDKGFEEKLILRLIHYSCEQGKKSWQYLKAALRGNESDNVRTLSDYERIQAAREKPTPPKARGICNYTDANTPDYDAIIREDFERLAKEFEERNKTISGEEGAKENDREGD